jgi:dTDP-4-dehydrorhamnose 3,5-epimerase
MIEGHKEQPTVTPDGKVILDLIDGVSLRPAPTVVGAEEEVCEIYSLAWGVTEHPVVHVYQTLVRPGRIKGWAYHKRQVDRIFLQSGALRFVLYDMRPESPSYGRINDICLSERNRGLLVIPCFVAHAVENIGEGQAVFINLPTEAYNHASPDKYTLPLDTPEIPFRFARR